MSTRLENLWYQKRLAPSLWALLPLEGLFRVLSASRAAAYRHGLLPVWRCPVPVIVVGNLTVGGTGKTPLVARLAQLLRDNGYHPGIISRGYGGRSEMWPVRVMADSDPRQVGDEPALLARLAACPVVAGPDRAAAAEMLVEEGTDVILSDDGLQHYRLGRELEVAVVDGARRFGNGHCLPAGPLRERPSHLGRVDWVVANGEPAEGEYAMHLRPGAVRRLTGARQEIPLEQWRGTKVHAVAGIGHPERFFAMLRRSGLEVMAHPFADHHHFTASELGFGDSLPVLMTEKDAVKCSRFARDHWWSVPVTAELDPGLEAALLQRLNKKR